VIRRALWGALAAACLLAPGRSHAFNRSRAKENPDACLFWSVRQVPFTLDIAGSHDAGAAASLEAARISFKAWTDPSCTDLVLVERSARSQRTIGDDNVNAVLWREKDCRSVVPAGDTCSEKGACNNKYDCWDGDTGAIALTTVLYSTRTGEIVDADIELNGESFVFTTMDSPICASAATPSRPSSCVSTDVQNTLTHEIGHFVGLDHSPLTDSTMYAYAQSGETSKRTLTQDDIDGVCTIYPRGQPTSVCVPQGYSALGTGCGPGPGAGGGAGVSVLAPIATLFAFLVRRGGSSRQAG
jgi:hypothetical protein